MPTVDSHISRREGVVEKTLRKMSENGNRGHLLNIKAQFHPHG